MTPQEIVDAAVDFLNRGDLAERLMRYLPQALRLAHSVQKFNRDLLVQYVPDPTVVNGTATVTSTELLRLRDIVAASSFAGYSSTGTAPNIVYTPTDLQYSEFQNLSAGYAQRDYFGWPYMYGWVQMGSNVSVQGLNEQTKMLVFNTLVWPTWDYNSFTKIYSTNSWIAELWPQLLIDHLIVYGARIAQQDDVLRNAQNALGLSQNQFIVEFTGDIYHGS